MASRAKHQSRSDRDSDSMEAVKPLVVLVLFGTILYGAYSVVQKGPSADGTAPTASAEAPAFAPPAVEIASPAPAPPAAQVAPLAPPASTMPPPVVAAAVPAPITAPVPVAPAVATQAALPAMPPVNEPFAPPPPLPTAAPAALPLPSAPVAVAAAAGAALGAVAAEEAARVSPSAPTYLTAESAPPPAQDSVAASAPTAVAGAPLDRPDRFATLAPPTAAAATALAPPPSSAASGSSAAFATAWADAHDKLAAGRYAEALAALSVWYDDPSLGLEESQRLEDLLGQLAGTVIYSQQDLLLPPHVVAAGETLPAIATPLGVSWQLLAKINGIADPQHLVPAEHLKLIRGPFDAVVSVSRRRLSLQLGGNYAGSFPVVVGRQFLGRVGSSLPVVEIRRGAGRDVQAVTATMPESTSLKPSLLLGDGMVIEAAEDPGIANDMSPATSLIMSVRDLEELFDILGPGSRVLVRQ
ncbi:MAG: LysM peptidoglycan-binding domain-containing protein [Pirellulales bacterium]